MSYTGGETSIPGVPNSGYSGNYNWEQLRSNWLKNEETATFRLLFAFEQTGNQFNFRTLKNGSEKDHVFTPVFSGTTAEIKLASELEQIWDDYLLGDESRILLTLTGFRGINYGGTSRIEVVQGGSTYDFTDWEPK